MNSIIRLNSLMRCGRPILPISKSRVGAGIISLPVIDDYSRYIIHLELCSSMTSDDVSRTIDKAIEKAGVTFQNPPVCYQIMDHVILLPLSNSISVRNIISSISMANPCIRRRRER